MGIPESQLATWSNPGPQASAELTHKSLRRALERFERLGKISYELYLQGSYRNHTNIRGDSDVDLVVQLNSSFKSDLTRLSESQKAAFDRGYSDATYSWFDFRQDVLDALVEYYGQRLVKVGKKCLKVEADAGRLDADVVVCMQYRGYRRFDSVVSQDYVEGITFYVPSESRWVINYPKEHIRNGESKNGRTNGHYKPTVRMFKNARRHLVDRGLIEADLAPSYFIECLLWNVPDRLITQYRTQTFLEVLAWVAEADLERCLCQNGQQALFGPTPEQWNVDSALVLTSHLVKLWRLW